MVGKKCSNKVFLGDNVAWLSSIEDESVDVCYIDPPFFTNRDHQVISKKTGKVRSFNDTFDGGIDEYISWMADRIRIIHQKLKASGSIFLHCDRHANHYLRVLLDQIFGSKNFRNEIVWKRKTGKGETNHSSRRFGSSTDIILFYAKDARVNKFNAQYSFEDASYKEYIDKAFRHSDPDGRRYQSDNLASPSPRPNLMYSYKGYDPPSYGWAISLEKMRQWDREGRLVFPKDKSGRIRRKRYLDELKGRPIQDLWTDIQPLASQSSEREEYPTQKPEKLIERIICSTTDPNDIVLDCFVGSGTTAKVAFDLKRSFIVGDSNPDAIDLAVRRLRKSAATFDLIKIKSSEVIQLVDAVAIRKKIIQGMGCKSNADTNEHIHGWDKEGLPIHIQTSQSLTEERKSLALFASTLKNKRLEEGVYVTNELSDDIRRYIETLQREKMVTIVPVRMNDSNAPSRRNRKASA